MLEMCGTSPGTGTKKLNFTGTKRKTLAGPEPGPKKNYRNRDRDQIKRVAALGPRPKKAGPAHI